MERALPVTVTIDEFAMLGAWLVLGAIFCLPAAGIMASKGQSAGAGLFLGFFLNVLGVGLAIICPASPERQARALVQAMRAAEGQSPPESRRTPAPIETRPPPSPAARRHRPRHGDPTTQFLAQPSEPEQSSGDAEAAQRSREIADLIRDSKVQE